MMRAAFNLSKSFHAWVWFVACKNSTGQPSRQLHRRDVWTYGEELDVGRLIARGSPVSEVVERVDVAEERVAEDEVDSDGDVGRREAASADCRVRRRHRDVCEIERVDGVFHAAAELLANAGTIV